MRSSAADADRVEGHDLGPHGLDPLDRNADGLGQLGRRDDQVSVVVDVADDPLGDVPVDRVVEGQVRLPVQVIPEGGRPGQGVLQGRDLALLQGRLAEAVVEVLLEIRLERGVLFAPGGLLGGAFARLLLARVGGGSVFGRRGPLAGLGPAVDRLAFQLEQGVLGQLLVDDLHELQVGHRQELDGLLQGGRQDQLLHLPLVQPLFHHGRCRSA